MNAGCFPIYTRGKPTPQFEKLIELYKEMHTTGYVSVVMSDKVSADRTYPGDALPLYAQDILKEIRRYRCNSLLDYGAGKAAYFKRPVNILKEDGTECLQTLQEYWGNIEVETYEPALGDNFPARKFDCVVNADVLEHIFVGDIPWVVDEMFSRANRFVFCNIACYPAAARLPTNEDAHITLRTPDYWRGVFDTASARFPNVDFVLACSTAWGREHARFYRRVDVEALVSSHHFAVT